MVPVESGLAGHMVRGAPASERTRVGRLAALSHGGVKNKVRVSSSGHLSASSTEVSVWRRSVDVDMADTAARRSSIPHGRGGCRYKIIEKGRCLVVRRVWTLRAEPREPMLRSLSRVGSGGTWEGWNRKEKNMGEREPLSQEELLEQGERLRQMDEFTREERARRYLEIGRKRIIPGQNKKVPFADASTECLDLYRDGHFIATVMQTIAARTASSDCLTGLLRPLSTPPNGPFLLLRLSLRAGSGRMCKLLTRLVEPEEGRRRSPVRPGTDTALTG